MPIEFAERIRRIPVYPAADGYALPGDVALLASNESPYPPIPAVVDAVTAALGSLNRYPDPTGVPAHRIAIGNGSCDILLAAGEALLEPGAEIVYAWPSFSVYPHLAAASGATAVTVPLDADERHDLPAMAREVTVATRLLIVCNPNNPTSTSVGIDAIRTLLDEVPQPFFCNAAAQAAAMEALKHQDAVAERVERAVVARVEMESGLEELG